MRVKVDFVACEANGLCIETAPEVFGWTDDDQMQVLNDEPGEDLRTSTWRAAQLCPKRAIVVE